MTGPARVEEGTVVRVEVCHRDADGEGPERWEARTTDAAGNVYGGMVTREMYPSAESFETARRDLELAARVFAEFEIGGVPEVVEA